jgi:glycine/D-amino acid oxidase-like deaminating enzyme
MSIEQQNADVVVVGAGIVGLATAWALLRVRGIPGRW